MLLLFPTAAEARALLDGLLPRDETPVRSRADGSPVRAALCGFGPAAAGVLATLALQAARPRRCLLAGLAGTYRPDLLPVGAVLRATEVRTADVGRGRPPTFRGPTALGLPQAPGRGTAPEVGDRIPLPAPPGAPDVPGGEDGPDVVPGVLLTVASSSGSPAEALERRRAHPDALAEDMEGFAVALACARLGVPLMILRGVSNPVGGEREGWRSDLALAALRAALPGYLRGPA